MAHGQTITLREDKLQIGGVAARLGIPALLVGIVALFVAARQGFVSDEMATHFFFSYLAAYAFFIALTLGAIIFVLLQHLTRAGWSVTVRRLAEGLSLNMFLMVVLILPLFAKYNGVTGINRLFSWFDGSKVKAGDSILIAKYGYLNPTFFAIRMGVCFVFWCWLAWFFAGKSAQQDKDGNPRTSIIMDKVAAPCMVFLGFSLTAFVFDWIMSLNPYWFSTIFGVYFFAGALLSALSAIVLLSLSLQKRGLLIGAVNHEHYHDLGKLMFAFTFFWGYIMFGQYMLIWYSNMPEETQFFIPRQFEQWGSISLLLLCVHLLIPFPGLLSRHVKRRNRVLAFWAVWSLCACALDAFYLVIPNEFIRQIPKEAGNAAMPVSDALAKIADPHNIYHLLPSHAAFGEVLRFPLQAGPLVVTALCFVGMGGLYVFSTMLALRNKPLVPIKDPRLNEALVFENI